MLPVLNGGKPPLLATNSFLGNWDCTLLVWYSKVYRDSTSVFGDKKEGKKSKKERKTATSSQELKHA
jgi:hypothetical protein